MIVVTRLNGKEYYINQDLIEFIEETPDTILTLLNGQKIVVSEPAEEIVRRIIEYKAKIGIHLPVVLPPDKGE